MPVSRRPRSRPSLLVHVGPHKTGSTAIQEFCGSNRGPLAAAGFCYPRSGTWFAQHAALPASLMSGHPFIPRSLLDGDPERVLDEIAREVPAGQATLLSSEAFWELLMFLPDAASRLFGLLMDRYRLQVLMVERPPESRAWSGVKHAARAGMCVDASVFFEQQLRLDRVAAERVAATGCSVVRIPYPDDDVVPPFLRALRLGLAPFGRLGPRGVRLAMLAARRRRSMLAGRRDNAAPADEHSAAFSLEFSRRLAGGPDPGPAACPRITGFMAAVLSDPRMAGPWRRLPDERALLARVVSAGGCPGSLLTAEESQAWAEAAAQPWVQELAARNGCVDRLQEVRSAGSAPNAAAFASGPAEASFADT